QAEDGIRDWSVTGVQTCALPICKKDIVLDDDAPLPGWVLVPDNAPGVNDDDILLAIAIDIHQEYRVADAEALLDLLHAEHGDGCFGFRCGAGRNASFAAGEKRHAESEQGQRNEQTRAGLHRGVLQRKPLLALRACASSTSSTGRLPPARPGRGRGGTAPPCRSPPSGSPPAPAPVAHRCRRSPRDAAAPARRDRSGASTRRSPWRGSCDSREVAVARRRAVARRCRTSSVAGTSWPPCRRVSSGGALACSSGPHAPSAADRCASTPGPAPPSASRCECVPRSHRAARPRRPDRAASP